ncbi:MAG: hypothetical protein OXU68_14180 [Bacteroidota bacterium]|nr:hypothetical protein [Bacteroidota bacterium]
MSLETAFFETSLVTSSVMTRGAVLAYTDFGTSGQAWTPLPYVLGTVSMTYIYGEDFVAVFIARPAGNNRVARIFDGDRVRFLVMTPAGAARLKDVDKEDYEAVMDALESY